MHFSSGKVYSVLCAAMRVNTGLFLYYMLIFCTYFMPWKFTSHFWWSFSCPLWSQALYHTGNSKPPFSCLRCNFAWSEKGRSTLSPSSADHAHAPPLLHPSRSMPKGNEHFQAVQLCIPSWWISPPGGWRGRAWNALRKALYPAPAQPFRHIPNRSFSELVSN